MLVSVIAIRQEDVMATGLHSFATLQLTPTPGDRRLYVLDGVGTLRLSGWASRTATAEAGGLAWQMTCRGLLAPFIQAADAAGAMAGEFRGSTLHRGGPLRWLDRELAVRPDSLWRERYVLVGDERRLATIEGRGWGRQPVNLRVDAGAGLEPGLLLFAVYVVGTLAQNAPGVVVTAA
jgi:hypothetical protein